MFKNAEACFHLNARTSGLSGRLTQIEVTSDPEASWVCAARCWGLICCTVASVIREMVRGSGSEPVVSPRSHAALLSIRGGVALRAAQSAERSVTSSPPAPSD